ncbi:MAG TPA: phenylalanine--tRNA ligase beta subunit-related protein [Solirubrobacteraceae bacterium]
MEHAVRSRYGDVTVAYSMIFMPLVGAIPPRIKKIARKTEAELRERSSPDTGIRAAWEVYAASMGLEGADLPAPAALRNEVLRGRNIPKINCAVDCANITALRYDSPVGVFDLASLTPSIDLRLATQDDSLVPIAGTEAISCIPGEVVYSDRCGVFSRYSRDAERSKVTEATRNLLCVVDGAPGVGGHHVEAAMKFMLSLLEDATNGAAELSYKGLLTASEPA